MLSKKPSMSASSTHWAETFWDILIKICDIASAVERFFRNPYEFGSLIDSNTGSRASKYSACWARSCIVGIPNARNFPFDFGIWTLLNGKGLYRCFFNWAIAAYFCCGESHSSRSTPAVRLP